MTICEFRKNIILKVKGKIVSLKIVACVSFLSYVTGISLSFLVHCHSNVLLK